jgi:hypothetical protein
MRRLLLSLSLILFLASTTSAAEKGFSMRSLWPFGKSARPATTSRDPNGFKMPAPGEVLNRAEQRTSTFFTKSRQTMGSVQEFGKGLVPPMLKPDASRPKISNPFSGMFRKKSPVEKVAKKPKTEGNPITNLFR